MDSETLSIEVWGGLACFTQPALSVERFTYPVMTPSAARGILDHVYWKPQFQWNVTAIEVLRPIRYIALKRNEVKDRLPGVDTILQWATGRAEPSALLADGDEAATGSKEKGRTQRQTLALADVRYRIHARIQPWPPFNSDLVKMVKQFRRRTAAGQYGSSQPSFGCREFPAFFGPPSSTGCEPIDLDVGIMLYDVFDLSRPGSSTDAPFVTVFNAEIRNGVLNVPAFESDAVLKPDRGGVHA